MKNLINRNDLLIAAAVLLLAAASFCVYRFVHSGEGAYLKITVDGKEYAAYPLDEDISFSVDGYDGGKCFGTIKDGTADFTDATCPDGICVAHSPIKAAGECIICLPNRVIAEIVAETEENPDVVAY